MRIKYFYGNVCYQVYSLFWSCQKINLFEKEINDIENDKWKLNKKLLEERMLNVNNELNNILIDNKNEFKQI